MRLSIGITFAVCLLSTVCHADSTKSHSIRISGGLSIPTGSFSEAYKAGFHGSVGVGFRVTPQLQIEPRLEFHGYRIREDYWLDQYQFRYPAVDTVMGGTLVTLLGGIDIRVLPFSPTLPVTPFFFGGLGWANISNADFFLTSDIGGIADGIDSQNKLYWNLGGGVDFGRASGSTFFAQIRFVSIPSRVLTYSSLPVTLGLRF